MTDSVKRGKSIEALKAFNNAIVMSKLYPPEAPQLANAVDRGYKTVKQFAREYGPLVFTSEGEIPVLCGQSLDEETLSSFANLVVFRQLRTLEMSKLVLSREMDRFAFSQLLALFNSSVSKIKEEGGGGVYVTALGLASFFAEETGSEAEEAVAQTRPKKVIKIRPDLIECLLDMNDIPGLKEELAEEMAEPGAVELLVAGIGVILKQISAGKKIIAAPLFHTMMEKAERLIPADNINETASGLAKVVTENLKEPALMVLLCQDFCGKFGGVVHSRILNTMPLETFGSVVGLMRQRIEKIVDRNEAADQYQLVKQTMDNLVSGPKGRQFTGAETAKNLLAKGEKERRKKRLESGLQGLLQGNTGVLQSDELLEYLPKAVQKMIKENAGELAEGVVQRLVRAAKDMTRNDELLAAAVTRVGWKLFDHGVWDLCMKLAGPMLQYIRRTKDVTENVEMTLELLQLIMHKSWHSREYDLGDEIVLMFHNIRSGILRKTPEFTGLVGRIQDKGIQRTVFPQFLAAALASPTDDTLAYRLIYQGPVAVRFLVDALINAEREADRFKIMDMLTSGSGFVAGIVVERLPELMPWYGKRNLLKLLGETGREGDADKVLPYLRHDDFRVQKEALTCMYKIGGNKRKQLLLAALPDATENIKIKIIKLLGTMADQDVSTALGDLLPLNHEISEKNRSDYLLVLLETLGHCKFASSLKSIEKFIASKGSKNARKIPDQVWVAAEKMQKFLAADLQELRKKHVQAGQLRKNALRQVAKAGRSAKSQRIITGLPQEQNIKAMISAGNLNEAKAELIELIERTAKARNFIQADQLREWLIEIDSSAYAEIIQAAEIIDMEKASAIDKDHLEIWSSLYDVLSTEEFSAIYHSLIHRRYLNSEQIITQGDVQSSLYFINSGRLRIFYTSGKGEIQLKTMSQGEVLGADSFFEPSVWTVSAAAVGTTELSILKLDRLNKWCAEYPGLESRLRDFCRQFENVGELIKADEQERRSDTRYNVSGTITCALVDDRDQKLGINTRGDIADISEGGVSWVVRIPQRENSRMLLGRKVRVVLPTGDGPGVSKQITGDVMAVKTTWAVESEYSIHVKFEQRLSLQELQEVISALRRETVG